MYYLVIFLNFTYHIRHLEIENMAVGIRHVDHVAPSIRKSWHELRRQAAVLGRYS
jgi:hypothetical protein